MSKAVFHHIIRSGCGTRHWKQKHKQNKQYYIIKVEVSDSGQWLTTFIRLTDSEKILKFSFELECQDYREFLWNLLDREK